MYFANTMNYSRQNKDGPCEILGELSKRSLDNRLYKLLASGHLELRGKQSKPMH